MSGSSSMAPVLRRIADYMSQRKTKADVNVLDIDAKLLPHFYILEVKESAAGPEGVPARRLRIRLCGTALDRAFGRAVKGHYMDEFLHGQRSNDVLNGFLNCAASGHPIWMRQVVEIVNGPPRYVEGVAFYVEPGLIYGGLVFGEIAHATSGASFESRRI